MIAQDVAASPAGTRCLLVKDGVVVNIVEYPKTPPRVTDDNEDVVEDVNPGQVNIGDAFDVTDIRRDRRLDAMDTLIFDELLRLTNEARAREPSPRPAMAKDEYRAFLKTRL